MFLKIFIYLTLSVAMALSALIMNFRLALTLPAGWSRNSETVLFFVGAVAIVSVTSWYFARWVIINFSTKKRVLLPLGTVVFSVALVALAFYWPTGASLLSAVDNEDIPGVRRALLLGVDVNTQGCWSWYHLPDDKHAITRAAMTGNVRTIQLLLDSGANINPSEVYGPLLAAAEGGHYDAVEVLLAAGSNVNQSFGAVGQERTAFSAAAMNGYFEVADLLIASGADIHLGDCAFVGGSRDISRLEYLAEKGVGLDQCLISAARVGSIENVQFLLDRGCDVNYQNYRGETAIEVVNGKLLKMERWLEEAHAWTPATHRAAPDIPRESEWNAQKSPFLAIRALLLSESSDTPDKP